MSPLEEDYAQRASAVSSIHALLEGYPLSVGIFRELVANSDDARASKQTFVLDQRNYPTEGLYTEGLVRSQGPAFMAFNNAGIMPKDWEALRSIHDSSKVADDSKIGKYGVGFRSSFNLTDSPQILSGSYLAIFDPLCLHLEKEGVKLDLRHIASTFPNQLLPFQFFMQHGPALPFPGTVIRCPLRNTPSDISDQVVSPKVVSELFKEFMDQELEISCLFLTNIECIEIYEVGSNGDTSLSARMTITRTQIHSTMFKATVQIERHQVSIQKEWLIIQKNYSRDDAVNILLRQHGYDLTTVTRTLQGAKFSPEVQIAVDITGKIRGRLFTHLPLPVFTGFPVHIHALFGIDTSRAHLRRASVGLTSGSQDHIKVQWNTMLFQTFIPRTWSHLLEELVSRGLVSDVFTFWPPERCSGELECYYHPLSGQLVNTLVAANAPVWPVYRLENQFRSLEALVVTPPNERECVLQALAAVGLSLTRPPKYIFELLSNSPENVSILDPDVAHKLLLENADQITQASDKDKGLLLDYLLSTKNLSNIRNLPLVPVASGQRVTISDTPGARVYTMLTRSEFDIFGLCDDSLIPLHRLPSHVADTLLGSGSHSVNVQRLTVQCITECLYRYSNYLNSNPSESKVDSSTIRWLSNFWEWFSSYEHNDELFPHIRSLPLLPSTKGLRKADSYLFKLRNEHHAYTMGYLALGVPFFPREFSEAAHGVLQRYGLAKSISDIPALLDSMALTHPSTLTQPNYESILKHLASGLDESISEENVQRLRKLPVFPVLASTTTGSVVTNWTAIPPWHSIRSVGRPRFIPVIENISFVGLDGIAPALVKFVEPSHSNPMSENDLVESAVENFTTQPKHLQLVLLRHITAHRNRIIQDIINKLSDQAFVLAEDNVCRVPGEIVDPESDIGRLYIGCSAHIPARSSTSQEIVRCLKALKLLRIHLNPEIVAERVGYISSRHTSAEALSIARNLLPLLGSSNINFSQVEGIAEKKWLPTNKGLCSAGECRHAALTPLALFDKVLAILEPVTVPPSLQTSLRWDEPLRIDVLITQLGCLLDSEHGYDSIVEVVKEFGRRRWSDEEVASLEKVIGDREWIPTTRDVLADVKSAVFKLTSAMLNSGFHQIRTDLKAETLLHRMGCTDYPTIRAILDKLDLLKQDSNHVDLVGTSISLLRSLPDDIALMEEHLELLIPDKDSQLRPFSEIFYNDIGENHRLVNSDGHFIVHPSLDEPLVRKLGLNRLGLRYAELRNIGPNMGQAPIITVTRTLGQYTTQQFLIEFLANAEDAKATEFTVAINHPTVREERKLQVLDPAMEYLCRLPLLLVHNNAQFTPEDFDGICHTSVGGKEGRPDTIGEFGLGVLTMYHFTDFAMVISGSRVLFLDPSKRHLPLTDCASLTLSLQHVHKFYKDHLVAVDGLFGFNMSSSSFDGTLFVLPLRSSDSTNQPIIPDFWSPKRINAEILEPFRMYAGDCLLFTNIHTISCITRGGGMINPEWSFQAQKTSVVESEMGYVVTDLKIVKSAGSNTHWKTVSTSCTQEQVLSAFPGEDSLLRKPSFAGLAARLGSAPSNGTFFSTLPLSTPTTLPMHVRASFKLSSDRRHIRLDRLGELQTKYNTWLLEDIIPPLYLFFLEHLLRSKDVDYRLRWPSDKGDPISNHIVNSFYSPKHLKASKRHLFSSLHFPELTLPPMDAVLDFNTGSIRHILERLRPPPVVDLPTGPLELAAHRAGLRKVDPDFIKNQILVNPGAITFGDNFQMIHDIIHHLTTQTDSSDILDGLPILPIEDGSFGTLDTRGAGRTYYLWKPKKGRGSHNFDKARFVHPAMKTKELEELKLNIFRLNASSFKRFVADKVSSFSQDGVSPAQAQWTDSFWDSWDEYHSLGVKPDDVASFPLVPTVPPSPFASLGQCKKGDVLLVGGDSHDLRVCFRELGLTVVQVDSAPIPEALRQILKDQGDFPPFNLQSVLSAIIRTGVPIPNLLGSLDDHLKMVFSEWARKNITDIQDNQISAARELPIWWSSGGGELRALRPASVVQLLPKSFTLQDAAGFMDGCVAEDTALTHLGVEHMPLDELPHRLLLPDVLDLEALRHYKQFYQKCASDDCRQHLPVPTSASTFQVAKNLFKREPLFTTVFPDDSPVFIHPEFEEFEKHLLASGMHTEERLDMETFKTCALLLDVNDPTRAGEVFRVFREILPTRIINQPDTWRELDEISFIPRRMDTERRLPDLDDNEPGLEIPPLITCLEAVVQPNELVKEEFEAVAWSQRACFKVQPGESACGQYPDFGKPGFAVVIAHLRYLSNLTDLSVSQRRILLHDVKRVYKYFGDHLEKLKKDGEFADNIFTTLRKEPLFLNIDGDEERLNWVKGGSLAINCHLREGVVQGVRAFLRPFEEILEAVGAYKVLHPSYIREHDNQHPESGISSSFDQLRREKALMDVVFEVDPTADVPDPEPLLAHRTFLAVSSEPFRDRFCEDTQESRNASTGRPLTIRLHYSWQCVRSFLDRIYTRSRGGQDSSLDLLLEILDISNAFKVVDLFDDVQGEIIERRLLRPDTVDKIKAEAEKHQARGLLQACTQYESANKEFIRQSMVVAQVADI